MRESKTNFILNFTPIAQSNQLQLSNNMNSENFGWIDTMEAFQPPSQDINNNDKNIGQGEQVSPPQQVSSSPLHQTHIAGMYTFSCSPRLLWLGNILANFLLITSIYFGSILLVEVWNTIDTEVEWDNLVDRNNCVWQPFPVKILNGSVQTVNMYYFKDPLLQSYLKRDVRSLALSMVTLGFLMVISFVVLLVPVKKWGNCQISYTYTLFRAVQFFIGCLSLFLTCYGWCYTKGIWHAAKLEILFKLCNCPYRRMQAKYLLEAIINCPKPELFGNAPASSPLCMDSWRVIRFPFLFFFVATSSVIAVYLKRNFVLGASKGKVEQVMFSVSQGQEGEEQEGSKILATNDQILQQINLDTSPGVDVC